MAKYTSTRWSWEEWLQSCCRKLKPEEYGNCCHNNTSMHKLWLSIWFFPNLFIEERGEESKFTRILKIYQIPITVNGKNPYGKHPLKNEFDFSNIIRTIYDMKVRHKIIPVFSLWQYHCTDSKELLFTTVTILHHLQNHLKQEFNANIA